MEHFKRFICMLAVGLIACTSISTQVLAAETIITNEAEVTTIAPRADVIVVRYRTYNGVYQYRRWNQTQGYWVDPEWIDM